MPGIKETKEAITAAFDVAIAGAKLKKDGLAGGVMSMLPLYEETKTAWEGHELIKVELQDLDANEIAEITSLINQKQFELLVAFGMDPNGSMARYLRNVPRAAALAQHNYNEVKAMIADIQGPKQ